jgi:sulfate permease, SulP family
MAGVWQLLLGLARAGRLTQWVSHTVIVGFSAGAAVLIVNSQIRNFFGVDISRGANVWQTIQQFVQVSSLIHWPAVAIGVTTLITARAWQPLNGYVPAMLIAVIIGALAAFGLRTTDVAWATKTVDALPGALPRLSMPDLSLDTL